MIGLSWAYIETSISRDHAMKPNTLDLVGEAGVEPATSSA